jgi:hypothetical protein
MPDPDRELRTRVAFIRQSGFFDDATYDLRMEAALRRQDPALHYLTSGEARGARPSRLFDPAYYRKKYKISGDSPLLHYLLIGRKDGLRPLPIASEFADFKLSLREGYKKVLVLTPQNPDGSFTDAATGIVSQLARFADVLTLCLQPLASPPVNAPGASVIHPRRSLPQDWASDDDEESRLAVEHVLKTLNPDVVVCLDHRSNRVVQHLSARFIPTITLVLEESSPSHRRSLNWLFRHSAAVVFGSEQLRENHTTQEPWLASRRTSVASLVSRAAEDSGSGTDQLLSTLNAAEVLMRDQKTKFERVLASDLKTRTGVGLFRPREFEERLRQNCAVGGLSTGAAPEYSVRRLLVGFDVARYASKRRIVSGNPAIDYLLEGDLQDCRRPVIRRPVANLPLHKFRTALHGHYYHTDVAEELFQAIGRNRQPIDIFLSTDTQQKADELTRLAAQYNRRAEVRVLPNRGRDIGPLLTGFRDLFFAGYDLIGHVHGKKSAHLSEKRANGWRQTLLNHIVGGTDPMADAAINAFAHDGRLGLAFPETSWTLGWDFNQAPASSIARRMNIPHVLTIASFDYPAGSFFWCRPAAMEPILALGLDWHDYPEEPVPGDGTILHAVERMVPFACEKAGFSSATIYLENTDSAECRPAEPVFKVV